MAEISDLTSEAEFGIRSIARCLRKFSNAEDKFILKFMKLRSLFVDFCVMNYSFHICSEIEEIIIITFIPHLTNIINAKVCLDRWLSVCWLLFHAKTELILMKLYK